MMGHNIRSYAEIWIIIPKLSLVVNPFYLKKVGKHGDCRFVFPEKNYSSKAKIYDTGETGTPLPAAAI